MGLSSDTTRALVGTGVVLGASYFGGPFAGLAAGIAFSQLWPVDGVDAPKPEVGIPTANPGSPIPIVFGTVPVNRGQIMYADEPNYKKIKQSSKGSSSTTVGYKVKLSFAVLVCEGPARILQVRRNGILVFDRYATGVIDTVMTGTMRDYTGEADQPVDPLTEELHGLERASAYPGICYMVLEDHDITDGFPQFSFVVAREAPTELAYEKIDLGATNLGGFSFATKTDDGKKMIGTDEGKLVVVDLISRETIYLEEKAAGTGTNNFGSSHTNESNPQNHIGAPIIMADGTFWLWEARNGMQLFEHDTNYQFTGNIITADDDRTSNPNHQGAVVWSGIRSPTGPVLERILTYGRGRLSLFDNAANTDENDYFYRASSADIGTILGANGLTGTKYGWGMIVVDPLGFGYILERTTGTGADKQVAIMKVSTAGIIDTMVITITEDSGNALGAAIYGTYNPFMDEIQIIMDAGTGDFNTMFLAVDFEEKTSRRAFSSSSFDAYSLLGYQLNRDGWGLPDSTWFANGADTSIMQRFDWNRMEIVETCDIGPAGPSFPLDPANDAKYIPQSQSFLLGRNTNDSGPADGGFFFCDKASPTSTNLCAVTTIIAQKVNYDVTTELDCNEVVPVAIRGAIIDRPVEGREFLDVLYRLHGCLLFDSGYWTRAKIRGGEPVLVAQEKDVGAYVGRAPRALIKRTDRRRNSLPAEISINFFDFDADWESNTQIYGRSREIIDNRELSQETYPGVLTADEALLLIKKRLKSIHLNSSEFETDLPPLFWVLEPGDIVDLQSGPLNDTFRVETAGMVLKESGLITLKGVRWDTVITDTTSNVAQPSGVVPQEITLQGEVSPLILDIPLLQDSNEQTVPLFYVSVAGGSLQAPAVIQRSTSSTGPFADWATVVPGSEIEIGYLRNDLPEVEDPSVVDNTNNIEISFSGTLTSAADLATLLSDEELNVLIIENLTTGGYEILKFQNATMQTGSPEEGWSLDTLVRGLRNTENHMAHTAGERVFVPTIQNLQLITEETGNIGTTYYYRVLVPGVSEQEAIIYSHTGVGRSKMPYSPVDIDGALDTSPQEWVIDFMARSRFQATLGMTDPPWGEDIAKFECDVLDSSKGSVIHNTGAGDFTISSESALAGGSFISVNQSAGRIQGMTITEADLLEYMNEIPNEIHLAIYQFSDLVGRGEPGYATLVTGSP